MRSHLIRNAGGHATDDAIRSLVISQQLLGTEEVVVTDHTGCGMLRFQDDEGRRDLAERTGSQVDLPLGSFDEFEDNLSAHVQRIRAHPWTKDVPVHGLIYEVESGRLREVA